MNKGERRTKKETLEEKKQRKKEIKEERKVYPTYSIYLYIDARFYVVWSVPIRIRNLIFSRICFIYTGTKRSKESVEGCLQSGRTPPTTTRNQIYYRTTVIPFDLESKQFESYSFLPSFYCILIQTLEGRRRDEDKIEELLPVGWLLGWGCY